METRTKIKRIHTHGEKSAAYMADGYARASGKPGICMAQVIGALNLAAGLRDALARAFAGDRVHRRARAEDQVPQGLPGGRRRAGVRAGDQVQRHGRRRRRAFPTWCGRRSASRCPARPGRCTCSSAATRARSTPRRPTWSRWSSRSSRACRRSARSPTRRACWPRSTVLQDAERPVIVAGGGVRASGAAGELVALAGGAADSGRDLAQRQGLDPRQRIRSRSASSAPIRARARTAWSTRADLVCFIGTETGGMTTHFWAVPKIGIAGDPDRHRPGGARAQLSAAGRACNGRRQGDAREDARAGRSRKTAAKRKALGRGGAGDLPASGTRSTSRCSSPTRCRSDPSACAHELTQARARRRHRGGRHRPRRHVDGRHVRPAHARRRATCAAPAISAGRSPAGLGAKCACPERPVVAFTGDAGFWYHIGEIETAVRWKINAVTVVNNNASGNQSKRGFDRVYGGTQTEQARELWTYTQGQLRHASPRTWARSASASRSRRACAAALAAGARRPTGRSIVDVVTDIEALAPTAVA